MALFGITGGIGSGKTTITLQLQQKGYPVFLTDDAAKQMMQHNPAVRSQIELLFGSDIYQDDLLDRKLVAQLIFNDSTLKEKLNHIVHPAVIFEIKQWSKRQTGICFVESAILFESGIDKLCKAVISITAPLETRIQRTMLRDNSTREQVLARINNQMPQEELIRLSDFSIDNNGTRPIMEICQKILKFCNATTDTSRQQ